MQNKKKVVLYNPKSVFFDMPLALLAIGSALDASLYEVIIIDGRFHEDPKPLLTNHIKDAICFGVTSLTGSPLKDAIEISKFVKTINPSCPIIWGGWHTSLFAEQPLIDLSFIDVTVQGQGEITFRELIEAITNGTDFTKIDGICYRDSNNKIIKNNARNLCDYNELPLVNYDLIDVESYFQKKGTRQLDYITSTGCFFRCAFCADPFVFKRKFMAMEAERLTDHLKKLHKQYKFTDINFQDETFFTYPDRIKKIAEGLISKNIATTWAATMRADQGSRMTEEDFILCKKSGLRRLLIGVESGTQEMLDFLKKDIKIEQIEFCAELCKKLNINVIFPFIVGFPNETEKAVNGSVKFIKKLRQMHPGFDTPIFYFKPYPGSAITKDMEAKGYQLPVETIDWADFDYVGSIGPWVSNEKYHYFEHFKFYLKVAYKKSNVFLAPLKIIAQYRVKNDLYKFPIERYIIEKFIKTKKLS